MSRALRRLAPALVAASVAACLAACGYPKEGSVPKPLSPAAVEAASARDPDVTAASLEAGRKTFLAACNGCHHYPDRDAIAEDRWPGILDRMARKARLTPEQHRDVLEFVLAARTAPKATP